MNYKRFGAHFEQLSVPMAVTDTEGKMVEVNSAFCEYLGYSRSELLNMTVFDITHPEDLDKAKSLFGRASRGEIEKFHYEKRYLRKDGTIVWASVTTSWVPQGDNGPPVCIGVIHDITSKVQAQQELQKSEELHKALVDNVSLGIALIDENHTILKSNPALARMFNKDPQQIVGKKCFQEYENSSHICDHCPGRRSLKDGKPHFVETEGVREDGSRFMASIHAVPIVDPDGKARRFIEVVEDVSQKRALESKVQQNQDQINYLAHHDQLTALPNRTLFYDRLKHAIDRSLRHKEGLAVVVFNLDRFRKINNSFGFAVGNQVLKEVCDRLRSHIRKADSLCRTADAEFALVLENAESLQSSSKVAQEIVSNLSSTPFFVDGHELHITASCGISHYPVDGREVDTLLSAAETALVKARKNGGNGYQYFQAEMEKDSRAFMELETQLHLALESEQLRAYFQPQVDPTSGRLVGMEALARWEHPQKGLVSPAEFIPLAEETGLIVPLGRRILEDACRQAMEWQKAGLMPFRVAVNVSALQISRGQFERTVEEVLNSTGLPAECLEVEITESALMGDRGVALKTLKALKSLGVSVALDDFGTGFSALSYLKTYPVDVLKIDRDFVRNVPNNEHDAFIVEAIFTMGKKMGINVIAEGVETADHLRCLLDLGCTQIQGYYFSKPLDAETLTGHLPTWVGPEGVGPWQG